MKKKIFNWGFIIVHTVWIFSIIVALFFVLDGKVNPVVKPLIIDQAGLELITGLDNSPIPWYRVTGTFEKIRNCQLVNLQWFYGNINEGSNQNYTPVATLINPNNTPYSEPTDLSVGEHSTINFQIKLNSEDILNNSYAYAYHNCYPFLPFNWHTRSVFYDSNIQQKHQDDDH